MILGAAALTAMDPFVARYQAFDKAAILDALGEIRWGGNGLIDGEGSSSYHTDSLLFLTHPRVFNELACFICGKLPFGVKFQEMWANTTQSGSHTKPHNHVSAEQPRVIVAVLYVHKPEGSGSIVIEGERWDAGEGDVLFFDGSMTHWTEVNGSPEPRTVVTSNLQIIGR
jgi:hypothetical protein